MNLSGSEKSRSTIISFFRRSIFQLIFFISAALNTTVLAQNADAEPYMIVEPVLDVSLRDAQICAVSGQEGNADKNTYYLTGTAGTKLADGTVDFMNNDGIYIWESSDLKKWKALGKVFDLQNMHPQKFKGHHPLRYFDTPPDSLEPAYTRGLIAPEIHYMKGTFWVTYSINRQGTGLLKSTSRDGPLI